MKIKAQKQKKTNNEILSTLYFIIAALLIRFFVVELFYVPTGSMKATILEGDYLFSTKYSYGFSNYSFPFSPNLFNGRILSSKPQRGDIIIFRPLNNMSIRYIKRLIGLPGDKVQLIDDVIYINDKPIEREAVGDYISEGGQAYQKYKEILPNNISYYSYKLVRDSNITPSTTKIFYVPEDMYFFLGDNRDESSDSRMGLGFVPFVNFIAKARFVLFSTKTSIFTWDYGITEFPLKLFNWVRYIRVKRTFTNINHI